MTVPRTNTASAPAVLARRHPAPQAVPGIVHDVLRAAGEPLSAPVRSHMESRFGRDFSQVRVHTDERSAEASQALGARAFTAGRSIVFGAGHYQPETGPGRTLLAHELTHVVQQSGTTGAPAQVGAASDPAEREARGVAQRVASGGRVTVEPSSSQPSVQCEDDDKKPKKLNLFPKTLLREIVRNPLVAAKYATPPETNRIPGSPDEMKKAIKDDADRRAKAQEAVLNKVSPGKSPGPGKTANEAVQAAAEFGLNQKVLTKLPDDVSIEVGLGGDATVDFELGAIGRRLLRYIKEQQEIYLGRRPVAEQK